MIENELVSIWEALTIPNIHAWIQQQIIGNEFSQAALLAGILGATIAWGRGIPGAIFSLIKRWATIEVRFNSDSPDYQMIQTWVAQNMVKEFWSRRFVFQTEMEFDHEDWREKPKNHTLTAGYGNHLGVWNRRPCLIQRSIEESSQTKEFKETLEITFLGRNHKMVHKFANALAKVTGSSLDQFNHVPLYINEGNWWNRMGKLPLRSMSSVITRDNKGQNIVDIIREFETKREEHHAMGLPHHLGIMLYGVPGTGKSSLIHAVATETKRKLYYLHLGSVDSDKELTGLLSSARTNWTNAILAIEDIDAAGVKVNRALQSAAETTGGKKKKKNESGEDGKISLSALLNVLDGMLCPDGLVVIATTNHHDRLDPALTRPGRFDHTIELEDMGYIEFCAMCELFGRDPADFDLKGRQSLTGAEMRSIILGTNA